MLNNIIGISIAVKILYERCYISDMGQYVMLQTFRYVRRKCFKVHAKRFFKGLYQPCKTSSCSSYFKVVNKYNRLNEKFGSATILEEKWLEISSPSYSSHPEKVGKLNTLLLLINSLKC